jgi:NTE family protein
MTIEDALIDQPAKAMPAFQLQLLTEALRGLFGEMNDEILAAVTPMLEWVEVAGGEVIIRQGNTDQDIYFVICGRLRALWRHGAAAAARAADAQRGPGATRPQRDRARRVRGRGFLHHRRAAQRDRDRPPRLCPRSHHTPEPGRLIRAYPQVTLSMARLIIARMSRAASGRRAKRRPTNLCLLPITAGIDAATVGKQLVARFPVKGDAILLTAADLEARLGIPGIANIDKSQGDAYRQLSKALDELESRHASVVYAPDEDLDSEWSQRCVRMADRVLLLADAAASPEIGPVEARYLGGERRLTGADQVLVLLHDKDKLMPSRYRGVARPAPGLPCRRTRARPQRNWTGIWRDWRACIAPMRQDSCCAAAARAALPTSAFTRHCRNSACRSTTSAAAAWGR